MIHPERSLPCRHAAARFLIASVILLATGADAAQAPRRVEELEALVLAREPGALAREARARALAEESVAARQLPDPELGLGLMSIPVGSVSRDREPMSQYAVGLMQRFPAGRSREALGEALEAESASEGEGAVARRELARRELRMAWVEWLFWRDSARLLAQQEALSVQLLAAREAAYASGAASREEVLGLRLERERLAAEIAMAEGEAAAEWARLGRWLPEPLEPDASAQWPDWSLVALGATAPVAELEQRLAAHPEVRALAGQIEAREYERKAAGEAYRPAWGLSLEYGARPGETEDGMALDDVYSARVSVELPLFPADRQDRRLAAARERREAARADRDAMLRRLRAELRRELVQGTQATDRLKRYETRLLPLAREAVLGAEASYAGASAEAEASFRARDAELSLRRDALRLRSDLYRSLARLAWLLTDPAAEASP